MSGDLERDGDQPDGGDPNAGSAASAVPRAEESRPELDLETAFADIVARYGDPAPAGGPWPAAEDVEPDAVTVTGPPAPDPPELAILDEHFVPPDVPPIRGGDLVSRLAWAGVIGGPLVLLLAAVLGGVVPSYLLATALLAFIGGFVVLVARMPANPSTDDGQDGAVL